MIPRLDDWVWVLAMMNQAMLGVISTNVRQVSLCYENGWVIEAILEYPSEEDTDDIEDVADETSIFMVDIQDRLSDCARTKIFTSISVSKKAIDDQHTANRRIVYRRKENHLSA